MLTLGDLEKSLLHHLWNRYAVSRFTVREIATDYNVRNRKSYAYNTILTVMTHLFEKGLLRRRPHKKTFHYELVFSKVEFVAQLSKNFIDQIQSDFGNLALAYFLKPLEEIDPKLLRRIAAEIKTSK